jgi:prepilin-type N-terminal cleavage/methylation domain-containing protein
MRRRSGFTLVEVLVALVVAVAAMALLSQGFGTGARASTSSQFATRAALMAQRVVTDFETGLLPLGSNQNGGFDDDPDFSYTTVSETDSVLTGLTKLTITVKWEERNQEHTFVLVRLMRERPTTTSSTSPSSSSTPTPPK